MGVRHGLAPHTAARRTAPFDFFVETDRWLPPRWQYSLPE